MSVRAAVGPRRAAGRPEALDAAPILAAVLIVAVANRLLPVLRGGGLSGVLGYDDAVYYAGAVGLVHGRLPYQDFLFLHPPGVLLALAPVAGLGRWVGETTGWEVSRLVWMSMGCLTSLLVARILLPLGRLAALIGGCAYAIFPGAVLVERTTLTEGLANLCLAAALALVIRELGSRQAGNVAQHRRTLSALVAAGALLGFSTTVKVWGVVPLLVVCLFVALALGARWGLVVALGAAAVIIAVCLPFFLAAPSAMWRMVVLDQLGRDQNTALLERAAEIATMGRVDDGGVAVVAVFVALTGCLACALLAWRARSYRVLVPVMASLVGLLLVAPIFYPHYLGVLAVPGALLLGVATGVLTDRPRREGWRLAVAVVGCLALALDVLALSRIRSGDVVPPELAGPVDTAPGCLTSDDPNNLLALGVVGRNVHRGCELVVDLGGYSHDLARGTGIPRGRNAAWQQLVLRYLGSGRYALATRFSQGHGYSRATAAEIDSWPVRLRVEEYELREPPR